MKKYFRVIGFITFLSIILVACASTSDEVLKNLKNDEFSPIEDYSSLSYRWTFGGMIDVRSMDVSTETYIEEQGPFLVFDSETTFPDSLSKVFDYSKAMELGKNPGLGIRDLHKQGIDGTGVNVAIIDEPLLAHSEYIDNIVHYRNFDDFSGGSSTGLAVSSLLVGESVGVAPKAKLYYTAFKFPDRNLYPDEDDWLFTVDEFNKYFRTARMKPLGDADNIDDFVHLDPTRINIPMDRRTTASPTGNDSYVHYKNGGSSWEVPYVAGVYALAKQVDPDITPEEFVQIAQDTRYIVPEIEDNDTPRPWANAPAPMINLAGIIEELQMK